MVALAEAKMLYAIVVHMKGEPYLRPKAHQKSFRELVVTYVNKLNEDD